MAGERISSELVGDTIKDIFNRASEVAELHACITSQRGDGFRLRLLQSLEVLLNESAIERLRVESGVNEYHRHLHKLLRFGLVRRHELDGSTIYVRTTPGEKAVDAVRQFERRVGKSTAEAVYTAALGPNSIRLFLRAYGHRRDVEWERRQITYSPAEIGRLCLFLPRSVDGFSAIDKLNEAGLLVYRDDNQIHMQPLRARSVYQYLRELYEIIADRGGRLEDSSDSVEIQDAPLSP